MWANRVIPSDILINTVSQLLVGTVFLFDIVNPMKMRNLTSSKNNARMRLRNRMNLKI